MKKFFLFILLLILTIFSCISSGKKDNSEFILVTGHLINEFQNDEKAALRNYKNKKLQVTAYISSISVPRNPAQRRYAESIMALQDDNCSFGFRFDYNVTSRHSFKEGDKITIQGTLYFFSKRTRAIYDFDKRETNPGENYVEEVEWSYFLFKNSEIVELEKSDI